MSGASDENKQYLRSIGLNPEDIPEGAEILSDEGTYSSMNRADWPAMAFLAIPIGTGAPRLCVMGMRYPDGRVSRQLMKVQEWNALSVQDREKLTVPADWIQE